eukprot:m.45693 g.45693  ORF g.45693 m.45693 type:complete len:507 (+) comp20038_c0_seq1:319-1839(+)
MMNKSKLASLLPPATRRLLSTTPWPSFLLGILTLYQLIHEPIFHTAFQRSDPVCDNLRKWVIEGGGFIRGVECVNMEQAGGRGLYLTETIPANEVYIELPSSLWMYSGTVPEHSKLGPLLANAPMGDPKIKEACGAHWDMHGDSCRLILALEYESKIKDSFWKEYIASLPEKPTALMFWNRENVIKTQSATILRLFDKQSDWYKTTYDILFPYLCDTYPDLFPDCSVYSVESLMVSGINVGARMFAAYQIELNNVTLRRPSSASKNAEFATSHSSTGVLLPMADLSNHVSNSESPYSDLEKTQTFTLRTAENYRSGAQLGFSYGSHHESAYFVDTYGFLPGGYLRSDYVAIKVRDARLGSTGVARRTLLGCVGIDGEIIPANFVMTIGKTWFPTEQGIVATDKARRKILSAMKQHLESLPTSYEEDMKELEAGFQEYTQFVSVNVRTRFKRIWKTAIESLEFTVGHSAVPKPVHLRPQQFLMTRERRFKRMTDTTTGDYALDQLAI